MKEIVNKFLLAGGKIKIHLHTLLVDHSRKTKKKYERLTLFRMGIFGAARGWREVKKAPLPKICDTDPTLMKLGSYTLRREDPKNI